MEVSEDVIVVVNHTLNKFYNEILYRDYLSFYNLNKYLIDEQAFTNAVQSEEKAAFCELGAGLWDKAITTTIYSLTNMKYPNTLLIKKFINYFLTANSCSNFGLLEELFYNLLLFYPPRPETFEYYKSILCDSYVSFSDNIIEENGLFYCLLDALVNLMQDNINFQSNTQDMPTAEFLTKTEKSYDTNLNYTGDVSMSNKIVYFEDLNWNDKIIRCLTGLNFIYNILETEFGFWLKLESDKFYNSSEGSRPLMSHFLWPEKRDIGLINQKIRKLLKAFILEHSLKNRNFEHVSVIKNLINLLAENVRFCDRMEELKYPFIGTKSSDFARELSTEIYEILENSPNENNDKSHIMNIICSLRPSWLRLLLCSNLLNYITGFTCSLDLLAVHDLLDCIFSKNNHNNYKEPKSSEVSIDEKKIEKFKKFKSINLKRRGRTLLQLACEINNVDDVKALLTFNDIDVNAIDRDGWTALHIASQLGHIDCVRELLSFNQMSEIEQKSVNARAKGPNGYTPLMCAIREDNAEICQLLLEHSGCVILEDINESNQTAFDIAKNEEIVRILKHFKTNEIQTNRKRLSGVIINDKYKELILKLSVEMILSYFTTYRIVDLHLNIKNYNKLSLHNDSSYADTEVHSKWDYKKITRDIYYNLDKLKKLGTKLIHVPEFKSSQETFCTIISLCK